MSAKISHTPVAVERCVDLLSPALINKSKPYLYYYSNHILESVTQNKV